MTQDDRRLNPDELLARVQNAEQEARRGKLKIFFGASPGVGKTYAMLLEARRLRAQGLDVVIGVVETHGRSETAVLMEDLELLPRREVEHRGRRRQEFDLDAALKRRPPVLLVDELAHSNAPGCRHPKRWQDVEELLAAGVDVLTTVNVQHIESLNDIVGGITGIRVSETVPDRVFAEANEVVLVDLTPDDLLVRLREGKVYLPEQAERAIQNFFRKGNLIALRELALRQTADRVDDQMRAFRRTTTEAQVWHTRDTLLACVGPSDVDEKVVRTAARLAAKLDATWHAVYVETPALQRLPEAQRHAILKTLKLAQDLGAETATLPAQDEVEALLDYARRNNLGWIVVGRSTRARLRWWGRQPFSRRLGAQAPDIDLIAVAREEDRVRRVTAVEVEPREGAKAPVRLRGYLYAALTCIGITVVTAPLLRHFDLANIVMLFLLGVVFIAYRFGRGPSALAAVLSVTSFDFFFVPPRLSFAVSDVQYLVTFTVMLIVGLVTGHLTARLRYQARVAGYREERARSLSQLAKALSSALVETQVVEISDKFVESSFRAKAAILLPDLSSKLEVPAAHGAMPACDLAVAQWCYDKNEAAGAGTDTLPANPQLYLPLKAPIRVRGVLVVEPSEARLLMIPEQRRLLDTFAALAAIALERIHFVSVAQETLIKMESERLRNALLAALSHDLRTPLTALVGLAETLSLELAAAQSGHADKANVIREQALRISKLMNNLLEMARLQSGEVKLRKDWQSIEEIIGSGLKGFDPALIERPLKLDLPANLPLVRCDALLIERVLVNLLENATKYTPPGTTIGVTATRADEVLRVEVWDEGPGLPPGRERVIFEKFARGQKESIIPGTGLGLAICAAIIEAHDGKIWAEHRPPHGARFIFTLPLDEQPVVEPEAAMNPGEGRIETHSAVLIVEDEKEIRRFVRHALEAEGFRVFEADTLQRGLIEAGTRKPDLVILDLGLPDGDGADFIREVRAWSTMPIVVLSARVEEHDKVEALDAGADDYLSKPYGVAELLARVRASLRRSARAGEEGPLVRFGDVVVDLANRKVSKGDQGVHLTQIEFRLLAVLLSYPGKVLTHRQLLRDVWGPAYVERSHYLRIYMGHLRQKLEDNPARPKQLITETGIGYRFVPA